MWQEKCEKEAKQVAEQRKKARTTMLATTTEQPFELAREILRPSLLSQRNEHLDKAADLALRCPSATGTLAENASSVVLILHAHLIQDTEDDCSEETDGEILLA